MKRSMFLSSFSIKLFLLLFIGISAQSSLLARVYLSQSSRACWMDMYSGPNRSGDYLGSAHIDGCHIAYKEDFDPAKTVAVPMSSELAAAIQQFDPSIDIAKVKVLISPAYAKTAQLTFLSSKDVQLNSRDKKKPAGWPVPGESLKVIRPYQDVRTGPGMLAPSQATTNKKNK